MSEEIVIKEVPIEEAVKVNSTIIEFDETYDINHFSERIQGRESLIIVAYLNGQAVGYIVGCDHYNDGSFYCWMAGVDPKFRRKGVLTALMDYQDKWAKEKGYTKIKIKTRNTRREMLAYLVKQGFNFIEVESREDVKENRIILEKSYCSH